MTTWPQPAVASRVRAGPGMPGCCAGRPGCAGRADAGALSRRGGLPGAGRGPRALRGVRHWRARHPAASHLGDRALPGLEIPDSLLRPARPGGHVRPARERALGPASRGERLRPAGRRGDALAVLDHVGVDQAVVVSWCGAGDDLLLAAEHPERVSGLVLIAPDLLLTADPAEEEGPFPFDEEPRDSRRMGQVEPPLLAAGLAGVPRFLLLRDLHRAALDQAARGRDRLGPGDQPRGHPPRHGRGVARTTGTPRCGSVPRCDARPWSSRARRTRSSGRPAARPWPRPSRTPGWSRSRAPVTRRTSGTRSRPTSSSATSPARPGRRPGGAVAAHAQARAVHLLADRTRPCPA